MSTTITSVVPTELGIRVLALDGGGIRGLSSLVLLRELMLRIAVTVHSSDPIRPCDYFDMIIGTGTGGLSALFVGRMRMTVDEAIKAYLRLGKEGFKQSAVPQSQYLPSNAALFDGEPVTRIIGHIVKTYVGDRDAQLHEPFDSNEMEGRACRTCVLATSSVHASAPPHVFRSHPTNWNPASDHAIHEVARATTATAGLFPPISLGFPSIQFIDAGVSGYNNPSEEALNEVERIWPGANVTCLVSLGTGLQNIVRVDDTWEGVTKVSRRLVEDCEKAHERLLQRQGADLPYYRFNVSTGLDEADVKEWDEESISVITAVTEGYTRKKDVYYSLNSCVGLLVGNAPVPNFEATSSLRLLETIRDEMLAEKIFKWLDAPDSSRSYNTACEKHQRGTCTWFINGHDFSQWKSTRGSFSCIYGKPGCGKTVLCSSIIAHLANLCNQGTTCAYAYFFFDGRDAQTKLQLHDGLIRSLIQQLSARYNGIPSVLVESYRKYGDGSQQPPTRDLETILRHILDGFTDAFLIIDSVDECVERVKLLNWIVHFSTSKADNVHLLVTSRPEGDITDTLQYSEARSITMEEGLVNSDMEAYIDSKMKEGWLSTRAEEVRSSVKKQLMTKAQGMFRWLAVQLDELQKCLNDAGLFDQLAHLPKDLDETYFRILTRIPEQRQAAAKVFLQWTAFSARPLSLEELGEPAAFEIDREGVPKYNSLRKLRTRDVLVACASLIIESEGFVKLSHFTVKEYLIPERITSGTASYFSISERLSHSNISRICLACLLKFDSLESLSDDTLRDFPLALYAANHWDFHVRSGENENGTVVQKLIMTLFESGVILTNWRRLHDYPWRSSRTLRSVTPNPLYYASLLGFAVVVRGLLEKVPNPDSMHGWDINSAGYFQRTALETACREGYVDVCKTLLDCGANINVGDGGALTSASSEGHIEIIQMLLDCGAEVNAGGGRALEGASYRGHIAIVKILLDHGADVNAGDGRALETVSYRGQIGVVKMLLDRGANVNAGGGRALEGASSEGNIEMVKTLLDHGADVNVGDYRALKTASYRGQIEVVKMLLDRGANVNAGDLDKRALESASFAGRIEIVKMLVDRGADINAGDGGALARASTCGYIEVVQALLDRGANVNAGGGRALANAASAGHIETVQMLLDCGANINVEDGRALVSALDAGDIEVVQVLLDRGANVNAGGGRALARASSRGRIEIVKMLLDRGANMNAGDSYGALESASFTGRIEIVKMLLDRGADVNAGDGRALVRASDGGYIKMVETLLNRGADVNAGDSEALVTASDRRHVGIVEMLLDHGADANAMDGRALEGASSRGYIEIVKVLLDHGADANARDGRALASAYRNGHRAIIKLLLNHGAKSSRVRRIRTYCSKCKRALEAFCGAKILFQKFQRSIFQ